MANTAPACGQCRHCRERGEAGQLHGSRSALILTGGLRALLPKKLLSEATQGTVSWLESHTVTARLRTTPRVPAIIFKHLHRGQLPIR